MKAASVPKGNYIEINTRRSTNATSRGEIDRKQRRRESLCREREFFHFLALRDSKEISCAARRGETFFWSFEKCCFRALGAVLVFRRRRFRNSAFNSESFSAGAVHTAFF